MSERRRQVWWRIRCGPPPLTPNCFRLKTSVRKHREEELFTRLDVLVWSRFFHVTGESASWTRRTEHKRSASRFGFSLGLTPDLLWGVWFPQVAVSGLRRRLFSSHLKTLQRLQTPAGQRSALNRGAHCLLAARPQLAMKMQSKQTAQRSGAFSDV